MTQRHFKEWFTLLFILIVFIYSLIKWHSFSIFSKATYSVRRVWWWQNIQLRLLMPSLIVWSFFDLSYCGFNCIFPVPVCPHHSIEPFLSVRASSVLIWSLFGIFSAAFWIKLLRVECLREAKRNITTGPLMLPNWAFPNWFSQNLPIYRDEFRKSLSLQHNLQEESWPKRRWF